MDALSLSLKAAGAEALLKPFRHGSQLFPGIWSALFPKDLWQLSLPGTTLSDCANCPQICAKGYRPDYRCCTYLPRIPNFLLGLASETEPGARALDRLLSRGMLLPEGLVPSPQQWLDFMDDEDQDLYGRSSRVLCPLLIQDTGLCGVHAFRNAVCTTYFCLHDQGESGEAFWGQLQTLGSQIEMVLSQWALERIGFDLPAYFERLNRLGPEVARLSSEAGWRPEVLASLWGSWQGRERELLRATAAEVVQKKAELWDIARSRGIFEAEDFERALDRLYGEDAIEEFEIEPLELTWQRCLEAYREFAT